MDRYEHFMAAFWAASGTSVLGAFVYVIRMVFTSKTKIEKLEGEIKARDMQRIVEREWLESMRADMAEIRSSIRKLYEDK